jgi:glucose-specific phosphotransferase system IIA component
MHKYIKIYAPVDGLVKDVTELSDPVFAQKMVGDGVSITPTSKTIYAPCDGVLKQIFKTNHAFIIQLNNQDALLVHLGIDTIDLEGKGFKRLYKGALDVPIKKGEPLIEMDIDYIKSHKKPTDVIMVITDTQQPIKMKKKLNKKVHSGKCVYKYYQA